MNSEKKIKKMSPDWLDFWDKKWLEENGELFRYNYKELDEDSVVLDIGGWSGEFAQIIYIKYGCNLHVFEPIRPMSNYLNNKFSNSPKVKIYNYALEASNRTEQIIIDNAGSSLVSCARTDKETKFIDTIFVRDIVTVLEDLKIDKVDLCKMNIEGAEYPLLERCLEKDLHLKFKNVQIQFHAFADKSGKKRDSIRKKLKKTHRLTYDYPYQWENWRLKD